MEFVSINTYGLMAIVNLMNFLGNDFSKDDFNKVHDAKLRTIEE